MAPCETSLRSTKRIPVSSSNMEITEINNVEEETALAQLTTFLLAVFPFRNSEITLVSMREEVIMKHSIKIFVLLLIFSPYCIGANSFNGRTMSRDQSSVVIIVKRAESYIKKNGIEKAIIEFRNSNNIVLGNYNGMFFISPLHPELIGKSQFNYKDPSGVLVVQEEINKAKAGGGWLKGRWRYNSLTGTYQCRKIYILPVSGNYFIGSWYHYSSETQGICLI